MPDKHPNTDRWGGPGSSHEDRTKPRPDPVVKDATDPKHLSKHSQVSGGGGEGDVRHTHSPEGKRDRQAGSEEKRAERGQLN